MGLIIDKLILIIKSYKKKLPFVLFIIFYLFVINCEQKKMKNCGINLNKFNSIFFFYFD